jgi:glycosyltransferase involved in cell wall biosynthesis
LSGGSESLIRICHLITGLDIGGAERSLVNLVTAMNRDEFDNDVVSLLKPGPMAQSLAQAGISVTSMEISHRPNPATLLSLIRYLRVKRPTILQTWLYHADFFGSVAAVFAKPDHLICNVRSSEIDDRSIRSSTRYLARLLAALSRRPDAIIVNSCAGQRYHERIGYKPKQWVNIANGVDLERFRPRESERAMLRTRLGVPADATVIGFVARYHPMKDIDTFLRAASRLQQDRENTKFLLCGDGLSPSNMALAALVRTLDLDHSAILLGPRSDIELIYPALDVLTLCSIAGEGFPNVLCEAMACDVPCVATDVGDSAEIIGDRRWIVAKRDHEGIVRTWRALLGTPYQQGGGPRSQVAARYSLQGMCAQYESFYRAIAQKRPRARDWH